MSLTFAFWSDTHGELAVEASVSGLHRSRGDDSDGMEVDLYGVTDKDGKEVELTASEESAAKEAAVEALHNSL